jgi:hypothetical protein
MTPDFEAVAKAARRCNAHVGATRKSTGLRCVDVAEPGSDFCAHYRDRVESGILKAGPR